MKWNMRNEHATVVTPDEEREMNFPVRQKLPPTQWKNFTPLNIVILFIQFCLVGVFLGAIIFNESEQKDVAPPQKVFVVTVERERKVGGGFKYRLVAGKKGGIEAIILENLPSDEKLAPTEDIEANEHTTSVRWLTTSDQPMKIITQKLKFSAPPQLSITKDASMPSPPVPPPWSSTSPGPLLFGIYTKQQRPKETSTRASYKFSYRKYQFPRG